jgi:uncharacterized protein YggE
VGHYKKHDKMKKIIYILTFGLLTTLNAVGQIEPHVTIADVPKILVGGVGTVTAFPNAAQITIVSNLIKPTINEVINSNQEPISQVLAIIKIYISDTTEIKISPISTGESTLEYDNKIKKNVLVGYKPNQKIIITLKNLTMVQNLYEEVLKTEYYQIEEIVYYHTDAANLVKQALEIAVKDAVVTTQGLAKAGNIKLGKIIYMQSNTIPFNGTQERLNSNLTGILYGGIGIQSVRSTNQLITFKVYVTMYTQID